MKLEGIVSQDGKTVVTEATGLQIVYFIHTKLDMDLSVKALRLERCLMEKC